MGSLGEVSSGLGLFFRPVLGNSQISEPEITIKLREDSSQRGECETFDLRRLFIARRGSIRVVALRDAGTTVAYIFMGSAIKIVFFLWGNW